MHIVARGPRDEQNTDRHADGPNRTNERVLMPVAMPRFSSHPIRRADKIAAGRAPRSGDTPKYCAAPSPANAECATAPARKASLRTLTKGPISPQDRADKTPAVTVQRINEKARRFMLRPHGDHIGSVWQISRQPVRSL